MPPPLPKIDFNNDTMAARTYTKMCNPCSSLQASRGCDVKYEKLSSPSDRSFFPEFPHYPKDCLHISRNTWQAVMPLQTAVLHPPPSSSPGVPFAFLVNGFLAVCARRQVLEGGE